MQVALLPNKLFVHGLSARKLSILKDFTASSAIAVFSGQPLDATSALVLWGATPLPEGISDCAQVIRVEDGFIRSVGLGADLTRPMSWVIDRQGIYFDATRPSDLEELLLTTAFSDELCGRAAQLCERLVVAGLTKYNLAGSRWQRPDNARRIILVPGQVESDASLAYGAPGIKTNMGLLQAVRSAHPDAYLIYKPHPDVLAGLRAKGQAEDQANTWCDEQITDVAMGELLPHVDEVHTMTSLTGFEALLRGKQVTCYGQPFYSSWGLTDDLLPVNRRTRKLTLDELVAGTLILYPTYISRTTGKFITPERAFDELLAWRELESSPSPLFTRLKRMVLRRIVGVR